MGRGGFVSADPHDLAPCPYHAEVMLGTDGRRRNRLVDRASSWLLPSVAALAAIAMVCALGRPWLGPTNDPDSMNSVLYFERILGGHRVEVTVLTTPKPLLTALYGLSWQLTGSWTILVWETIAAHAVGVALATRLVIRLGGIPAGFFLATALILYPPELTEALHANALPFAIAAWSAAGLAATGDRPRWWLAGGALFVGALARQETLLILAAATFGIAIIAIPAARARWRTLPKPMTLMPVLVAWLAVPVEMLHDQLLSGNALYTWSVPTAFTQLVTPGLAKVGPLAFAGAVAARYAVTPLLVVLAIVGFVFLLRSQRWAIVLGVGAVSVGGLSLLAYLAWRGIYVSTRYYEEPTLALVFLAAVAVGGQIRLARASFWPAAVRPTMVIGVASVLCALVAPPVIGVTRSALSAVRTSADVSQAASHHLDEVAPRLHAITGVHGPPPAPVGYGSGFLKVDPTRATLFVPGPLLGRIAVETNTSLTLFGDLAVAFRFAAPAAVLRPGQVVYHDPLLDQPAATFRIFQIDRPASLDGKVLLPLAVKPGVYWLVRVE